MSDSEVDHYFKAVESELAERRAAAEKARADRATDQQRKFALLVANEWAEVVATMKRITQGKTVDGNRFRFVDDSVFLGTAIMELKQFRDEYQDPEYRGAFRTLGSFEVTTEARFLPESKDGVLCWKTSGLGAQSEQSSAQLAVFLLKALADYYKTFEINRLAKSEQEKAYSPRP